MRRVLLFLSGGLVSTLVTAGCVLLPGKLEEGQVNLICKPSVNM